MEAPFPYDPIGRINVGSEAPLPSVLREIGPLREVPGPQAPREDREHPVDGRGEAPRTVSFLVENGVLFVYWPDGRKERVGHGYREIGRWWRDLLAKDLGLPSSDDPRYPIAVDRIFSDGVSALESKRPCSENASTERSGSPDADT